MKHMSTMGFIGFCVGLCFGALLGAVSLFSGGWAVAVDAGRTSQSMQIRADILYIDLGTCAGMLREDTLKHQSQKDACADVIDQTLEALEF